MVVYNYDNEGLYTGPSVPPVNPKQPEQFLKPAMCTEVAPPEGYPVEQIPKWDGSSWSLVESPYKIAQDAELARQEEEAAIQAAEAQREIHRQNAEALDENGIMLYHVSEDANGDIVTVAKTAQELADELAARQDAEARGSLLSTLKQNIMNKGAEITGGIDADSIAAFFQAYQLRAANPAEYIADGLTANYAVTGYAVNDALDTEAKITDYYNKVMVEMDKFREAEYAAYKAALAAL